MLEPMQVAGGPVGARLMLLRCWFRGALGWPDMGLRGHYIFIEYEHIILIKLSINL
jgi:hypothetical protein